MSRRALILFFLCILLATLGIGLADSLGQPPANPAHSTRLLYRHAAILGLVEGITEYLPISSTGHLIIASHLLGLESDDPLKQEALNAYLIIIQGGAILSVGLLYRRRVASLARGLIGRDPKGLKLGLNLIAAFFPAAFAGLFLDKWIQKRFFCVHTVSIALVIGALMIFALEYKRRHQSGTIDTLTLQGAALIGLMQCFALWPGMSRSLVSIMGGILAGLTLLEATQFSFLLGLFTLSVASLYKIIQAGPTIIELLPIGPLIVGVVVATASAWIAVRWLVRYIASNGLIGFAYYRLIVAIILFSFFHK